MAKRLRLTQELQRRVDELAEGAISSGLKTTAEIASYVRGAKPAPTPLTIDESMRIAAGAIKRLRTAGKIQPSYRTPRGAACGGWKPVPA